MVWLKKQWSNLACGALMVLLAALNVVRIFNSTYWLDEGYSIMLTKRMSFTQMIAATAEDVHPPLYYTLLKIAYRILGDHGYTYHLVSILPVLIMILFSWLVVRKKYGCLTAAFFSMMGTFSSACLIYNREVRMYSLANLLVFLCFWYGVELLFEKESRLNWCAFTLSGILAAYTHYYALISVFFIMAIVYILLLVRSTKNILKCCVSAGICIVLYLPWLKVLLTSFAKQSSSPTTVIPSGFFEALHFLAGTNLFSRYMMWMFVISVAICILTCILRRRKPAEPGEENTPLRIRNILKNRVFVMCLIMAVSTIGTVAVGVGISEWIRPMFFSRYAYGCIGMIHLCIVVFVGMAFQNRKVLSAAILCAALVLGLEGWISKYESEVELNDLTSESVAFLRETCSDGSTVICEEYWQKLYTIFYSYFDFDHLPYWGYMETWKINYGSSSWLLLSGELGEDMINGIASEGGTIEYISSGTLSNYEWDLYRIEIP